VKFVGWGGIPQVFASPLPPEWRSEGEELKALLAPDEYEAARASTLNAHYTSATVISAIYDALDRMGFDGGRVLEPALGIGHFYGIMPEEITARSRLTGIEIDPLTAAVAQQLYPDANFRGKKRVIKKSWSYHSGRMSRNYSEQKEHTAVIVHCERGYSKRLLAPLEPDGQVRPWYNPATTNKTPS
jgi:hypothetical protein